MCKRGIIGIEKLESHVLHNLSGFESHNHLSRGNIFASHHNQRMLKDRNYKNMGFGKVIKEEEAMITILKRDIVVRVREFESGLQRVNAAFVDRNRTFLTKQNRELRVKVQELEKQLKESKQSENENNN